MALSQATKSLAAVGIILAVGLAAWRVVARPTEVPPAPPRPAGPVPVSVRTIAPRSLDLEVEAYGTLLPARAVTIALEVGGRIETVHAGWRPGAAVEQGEVLVALEALPFELEERAAEAALAEAGALADGGAVELRRAEAAVGTTARQLELARAELARTSELEREGSAAASARDRAESAHLRAQLDSDSAQAALDGARAAGTRLEAARERAGVRLDQAVDQRERSVLRAPMDACFTGRGPQRGELVAPGIALGELVDVSVLHLSLSVMEDDLEDMKIGLRGRIELPSRTGITLIGRIRAVGARVDPTTRSAPVELEVANGAGIEGGTLLAAGQFARATIELGVVKDAVWIARSEIDWSGGRPSAFVIADSSGDGSGREDVASRRELELGAPHGEGFVVLAGLAAGDVLITGPLDRLRDGRAVGPLGRRGAAAGAGGTAVGAASPSPLDETDERDASSQSAALARGAPSPSSAGGGR